MFFAIACLVGRLNGTICNSTTFGRLCAEVLPTMGEVVKLYPPALSAITLFGSLTTFLLIFLLFVLGKRPEAGLRKYVTWDCGYGNLPARAEETGTSFSESIARIFAPILRYRHDY